ncbi:flagellar basal-body MS-ring/collar protein FliF [Roseovarius sp. CAU 1744]|uniref:flagellar basal-body MS-ring/collar protein FliF n=1 Tax=Roseovarius sp. CAU 1744 TaxID=3140368 RepID=UPI00325BACDA
MQQIVNIWSAMDIQRRVIVVVATLAMFGAVLSLTRMASAPSLTLLYSGLENGAAGDVVTALEQRGVAYDVRGGSIFVEAARRDELRMTLASEGLPANSSKGYELLDNLSGFGTTSQMFDAAYWRAKEGELARTIVSHPAVTSARVHIANIGTNPFQRNTRPSASVSVTTTGGGISAKHARALKFLVAAAVTGLTPEEVSVIDGSGNLVGAAEEAPENTSEDRADAMRQRVQRLLEARVGPGNAVVEISVDTVTQTESIRQREIDPQSRVAISTDTEERSNSASDQGGGDVTVASNLPDGDAAGGDSSSSQTSETRERVNYEVSATEREITNVPGAIKRVTVAVLVNGTTGVDDTGAQVYQPRSDEELSALRELVSSAVGFDEARGDVITLKTMQFETIAPAGTVSEPSMFASLGLDVMSIIQAVVLGIVAIVLGLFVVRPLLSKPPAAAGQLSAPEPAIPAPSSAESADAVQALTGEIAEDNFDGADIPVISGGGADSANAGEVLPALGTGDPVDPVERLRGLIGERQEETVEILRSWLEGEEENA